MKRSGFTLIELLVAMVIIGILASLMLGALQKANTRAKVMKTQATIAKIHQQVMTKWESYKYRRLPVDPKLILTTPAPAPSPYSNALKFIAILWANRGSQTNDPLAAAPGTGAFPTTAQLAAARLAAMRELQRYEMPTGWTDVVAQDASGNWLGSPGAWQVRPPTYLLVPPGLAQAYVQKLKFARDVNGNPPSQKQLQMYDAAECLYLVVKLACEEENVDLGGSLKEVGDADGDGLLEFQDAFAGMDQVYATTAPANNPIMWNRWPAGYNNVNLGDSSGNFTESMHVSDFQDDPLRSVEEQTGGVGKNLQVVTVPPPATGPPAAMTFAADNHDYFDPLRLDMPVVSGASVQARGYQLTPLIYSAGIDSIYGIVPLANDSTFANDPYAADTNGNCNAQWFDPASLMPAYPSISTTVQPYLGVMDNITNHVTNSR